MSRKLFVFGPGFHFWLLAKPWILIFGPLQYRLILHFFTFFFSFVHFFHFFGQNRRFLTKITFFCQFLSIFGNFDIFKNDHFWDIFWRPFFGHFQVVQIWLAKLELFPGFSQNPKKGSKKWSRNWSFLGPPNVQNDQNIDIFACYPLEKLPGSKKVDHFLFTFFQGSENSSSPPNDFLKKRDFRCLKIVKKREITFLTVLAILGFLKIPYVVNDVFFNFCHFLFVFFCDFWRQKITISGNSGFGGPKTRFFVIFWIFVILRYTNIRAFLTVFLSFHFFHFFQKVYFTTWRIFSFFTF